MYIKRISIKNIRSIYELEWELDDSELAGWHVLIGDNGSGKSTFLRAVSLALIGWRIALRIPEDWDTWLTGEQGDGKINLTIMGDSQVDKGANKYNLEQSMSIQLARANNITTFAGTNNTAFSSGFDEGFGGSNGWFSAAYGPFRRFTGGSQEAQQIYTSSPKLAAHLSVFLESVALTECVKWLQDLKFKQLEEKPEGKLLDSIKKFVNQKGFLPHQAHLKEISSSGVTFIDANNNEIPVELLSDGYRSILSMTFDLIRQLQIAYPEETIFSRDFKQVVLPGVVLIDEVDAHLHPTWQRQIGIWFREHFPNMQFIVTTHSPLVCQAADKGTVWKLPNPGTNDEFYQITGQDLNRLVYGNILDAYGTEVFGENVTRSDKSQEQLDRLAELNLKELRQQLTVKEREEQQKLRATLPSTAYSLGEEV